MRVINVSLRIEKESRVLNSIYSEAIGQDGGLRFIINLYNNPS